MRSFILSLFVLLYFSSSLMAGGSLSDDVPAQKAASGRSVPYARFEVMKIPLGICVCENETPEQAAKTIAKVLKHYPECLPSLQMLPTAPSHLVAHFADIKLKVDQIINNESSEVLVAEVTQLENDDSSGISNIVQNQETSQGYFAFHSLNPMALVRTETAYVPMDRYVYTAEREDQKDTTVLAYHEVNGPKNLSGGDYDTYVSSFLTSSNGIFVATGHDDHLIQPVASTSVKESISDVENKNFQGTRVPPVMHDTHVKVQQAIDENASLVKTSALSFKYGAPQYLEVLYVMFLLTILANYFGRLLKPRALVFARLTRRVN